MKRVSVALRFILSLALVKNSVQQHELKWYWDRNHYVPEYGFDPQRQEQRTLLVVQDAAYGAEQQVIEVTQRVNRAYAKRWGYDYAKLVGIAVGTQPWERSFNKAYILDQLVKAKHGNGFRVYDTVLMLDSNAVIVDLDFDILSLIPTNKVLANGIRYEENIKDMYSDVMMWNLNNPQVENIAAQWIQATKKNAEGNFDVNSEVLLLEVIKKEFSFHDRRELLELIPQRFINGLDGTVIKQDGKSIKDVIEISDLPIIIPTLQGLADSVCYRFYPQCEVIGNF